MFNLMKAGHVLRFGTDPTTIISPKASNVAVVGDNALATPWPTTSNLGNVQCLSHPSGSLGKIAADVATSVRTGSISRSASYSGIGRAITSSDRNVGSVNCDFVGYTDGKSMYIQSANTVFSKDFSGCLMVAYTLGGQRHVAHAAASQVPNMDCKQAFLNTIRQMGAALIGWFKPYEAARDDTQKFAALQRFLVYMKDPYSMTTFGVVTAAGQAYSIDAFKPKAPGIGNSWVITHVSARAMNQNWNLG